MKIHKGTQGSGEFKRPCRWIEPRTTWEFELQDLLNGLGSHYWRDHREGDEPPSATLTADGVVAIAKGEHERYGTETIWTWADSIDDVTHAVAEKWARDIILAVLPELEVED